MRELNTIQEAKEYLYENLNEGAPCPCCKQFVKEYKRIIHSAMAKGLITLYRRGRGYYHLEEIGLTRTEHGDFAKLAYWGLIERDENDDESTKRTSGRWRITDRGVQFTLGNIEVIKYAHVYNGKILKLSGDNVDIFNRLGKKFDYSKLMGACYD
jgi:hypothetical protein